MFRIPKNIKEDKEKTSKTFQEGDFFVFHLTVVTEKFVLDINVAQCKVLKLYENMRKINAHNFKAVYKVLSLNNVTCKHFYFSIRQFSYPPKQLMTEHFKNFFRLCL